MSVSTNLLEDLFSVDNLFKHNSFLEHLDNQLGSHIDNYLAHPLVKDIYSEQQLIELVDKSASFKFDSLARKVVLQQKPPRNIVEVTLGGKVTSELVINLVASQIGDELESQDKREHVLDLVFKCEDKALEAFKVLSQYKEAQVVCMVKAENRKLTLIKKIEEKYDKELEEKRKLLEKEYMHDETSESQSPRKNSGNVKFIPKMPMNKNYRLNLNIPNTSGLLIRH